MGKVSDRIRELIERQVADRGLVVWYDPDEVYASLAKSLVVDDATVLVGDTGFFCLRERLEPLLEFVTPDGEVTPGCGVPPNVVVYVPEAREKTEFALIEADYPLLHSEWRRGCPSCRAVVPLSGTKAEGRVRRSQCSWPVSRSVRN